ncbi:lytic transglycosylase domain-containing protein [Erythrobacter sanguineus]|uniref:Transglycosylase SLT domain-containing protein n=1 Tax=Erythrobacter sanguineus TaxID=198312 RepID=A0A1M7S0D5_9SPHN|nr:lytic transglycosylase domain-containing protein [Erythrobacter sanguineus]SHN51784.1 Transglycosylase SLT domain-containing protein [Erythrobacter sanguineus]
MILAAAGRVTIAATLLIVATAARADVLELGADGARWVAGPLAGAAAAGDLAPAAERAGAPVMFDGLALPESMIADPARHAAGVPARYSAKIHELSQRFDLSPSLLEAVVWQESRWRENAVSPAGARGLAQLMPGTARYLGVDPSDPFQNLEGGARYLREQLDRFDGDLEKALAAYNAGPGRVERAGGIPNIRETQNYVASIMGRLANHARPAGQ